jgi:hypothetical protein
MLHADLQSCWHLHSCWERGGPLMCFPVGGGLLSMVYTCICRSLPVQHSYPLLLLFIPLPTCF